MGELTRGAAVRRMLSGGLMGSVNQLQARLGNRINQAHATEIQSHARRDGGCG